MNDVEVFIERFQKVNGVEDLFIDECSYWFAVVLYGRFIRDGATIVFDRETYRFGTKVKGRVYNIIGDVTTHYNWVAWNNITDKTLRDQISKKYIMF